VQIQRVRSRHRADKPALPGRITMAACVAGAVAAHVADGLQKADAPELQRRLETCSVCELRNDDRCTVCGCYLERKHVAIPASWTRRPAFFAGARRTRTTVRRSCGDRRMRDGMSGWLAFRGRGRGFRSLTVTSAHKTRRITSRDGIPFGRSRTCGKSAIYKV